MFFSASAALALVSLAAIPARAVQHQVTVGGSGSQLLQFTPNNVNASVGDTVVFTFEQKNHTATQSSLADPCSPLAGGFDSGFVPVADDVTSGFPVAELPINDTNPIWVFCRQTGHCQQGMVFAVNPGDKFSQFQAAALASGNASTTATSSASVVTVTATVTVSDGDIVTTTYGSYPGSAEPTSLTSTDHKIVVGGDGIIAFNPSNIEAQPGDTITFEFHQKNHTATQSSFNTPCIALSKTSTTGQVGFDSGFMPVGENATTFPTFTVQVNDTAPIWVYCRQTGHCGQGMVFAANAVENGPNNFNAFVANAKAQNGTSATTSGSSPSKTNGASLLTINRGAGVALSIVALVFGILF